MDGDGIYRRNFVYMGWIGYLILEICLLSNLLDPRIKELSFVTISQQFDAEELLSDLFDKEKQTLSLDSSSNPVQVNLENKFLKIII